MNTITKPEYFSSYSDTEFAELLATDEAFAIKVADRIVHEQIVAENKVKKAARLALVRAVKKAGLAVVVRETMEQATKRVHYAGNIEVYISNVESPSFDYDFNYYTVKAAQLADVVAVKEAMSNLVGFEIVNFDVTADRGYFIIKAV